MIVPENRAVVPVWPGPTSSTAFPTSSAPPAPTSTLISALHARAHAMSDGGTDLGGKSRTLQGPSAQEWANHRETIISLYRQYPLKKVSEIMRKEHNFSASKRMYDKRFREWNVFKNVNNDERARAARRARGTGPSSPAQQAGQGSNFGPEDLRRTIRCARTIQQSVHQTPPASSPSPDQTETGSASPPSQQPSRQPRRSISISDLIKQEDWPQMVAPQSPVRDTAARAPFSPPSTPSSTSGSISGVSDESISQEQDDCGILVHPGSRSPSMAAYKEQLQRLFNSPAPPMSLDSHMRTLKAITLKLDEYFDWQMNNIPPGFCPDKFLERSPDESKQYWSEMKNALYLVKLSAGSVEDSERRPDHRAWSAFAEAGQLATGAMRAQPFDFLRNVFATLSPVNTRARPELRAIILQFLAREAQSSLSPNHPIAQICRELLRDENCQEISQRSLRCMLDIFKSRLGRSRAITFKLNDSLATLLRRSGEYHAGLEIITELLNAARLEFGPDSDQVRSVENELAHFYMLVGDYDLALSHCMSAVTRPPSSTAQAQAQGGPTFYQDGIAAHAMEDIAEIYQRRDDLGQCIAWLERAATIALTVWGPKAVATGHLIDKMTSLQRQLSKDLLESATRWEAALSDSSS
ncbi:hypothetical protein VTH06DRAFT_3932 [Thermothelomyces fergusii]